MKQSERERRLKEANERNGENNHAERENNRGHEREVLKDFEGHVLCFQD